MSEILIYDGIEQDSTETPYMRGDVVVIKDDSHVWGKEEHPFTATQPTFVLVKSQNSLLSDDDVSTLTSPWLEYDENGVITMIRKREWYLNMDSLSEDEIEMYLTSKIIVIDWSRLSTLLFSKKTSTSFG